MSRRLTAAVLSFATLALASLAPLPQAPQERAAPPARWVVLLETAGKFDAAKPVQEQPGFAEHLAHVERLARDGTLLLGGPLLDGAPPKLSGGLWVVQAASEAAARKLVGDDPMRGRREHAHRRGARLPGRGRGLDPGRQAGRGAGPVDAGARHRWPRLTAPGRAGHRRGSRSSHPDAPRARKAGLIGLARQPTVSAVGG